MYSGTNVFYLNYIHFVWVKHKVTMDILGMKCLKEKRKNSDHIHINHFKIFSYSLTFMLRTVNQLKVLLLVDTMLSTKAVIALK